MTVHVWVNDFHCALLWIRSIEQLTGAIAKLDDNELRQLFLNTLYRSPWKA